MSEERVNTGGTVSFVYTERNKPQLKTKDKRFLDNYYQNIELAQERQDIKKWKLQKKIKDIAKILVIFILFNLSIFIFSIIFFLVWSIFR